MIAMLRELAASASFRIAVVGVAAVAVAAGALLAASLPLPAPRESSAPLASHATATASPVLSDSSLPPAGSGPGHRAYFIAPDGSDANVGTIESPWLTFVHAGGFLKPGDTLFARGGVYHGQSGIWPASGTASEGVLFRSYGDERAIFDGDGVTSHFVFFSGTVQYVTFAGLSITGYHPTDSGIVELIEGASHITLDRLTMTGNIGPTTNEHLIYIAASDVHDIVITHSRLDGIGGGAIHLYHPPNGRQITIDHNVISNAHWGVIVTSGADDVRIRHNTFFTNDIAIELGASRNVAIEDNLSYSLLSGNDLGVGLWIEDLAATPGLSEDHNLWFRAGGTPIRANGRKYDVQSWRSATGFSLHSIEADPRIDANGVPEAGSPAIGASSDGGTIGAY